jgi:hypothetical protein
MVLPVAKQCASNEGHITLNRKVILKEVAMAQSRYVLFWHFSGRPEENYERLQSG